MKKNQCHPLKMSYKKNLGKNKKIKTIKLRVGSSQVPHPKMVWLFKANTVTK